MTRYGGSVLLVIGLALAACGPPQIFPRALMDGVETNFDFTAWRNVPNAQTDRKVQLGGRIVQTNRDKDGLVIIVTQLPIVEQPAYGPKDNRKRSGEFAVVYPGALDPKWLAPGHRLVVIGTTAQAKAVMVDDVQRSLPSLIAECVHVWRTAGREISDFPYNTGGGYEPLGEETHCAP